MIFIYYVIVLVIVICACFLIEFSGDYLKLAGKEQNNSNLTKAGKRLSIAGKLLGVTASISAFIGFIILIVTFLQT